MKKILLLLIISLSIEVHAQKALYLGGSFGLGSSITKVDYDNSTDTRLKGLMGFTSPMGLSITYGINNRFSFSTQFHRVSKLLRVGYGGKYDRGVLYVNKKNNTWSMAFSTTYHLPISKTKKTFLTPSIGFSWDFHDDNYGDAGGAVGDIIDNDTIDAESCSDSYMFFNRSNNSLRLGLGFEKILKNNSTLNIGFIYSYSLKRVLEGKYKYWEGYYIADGQTTSILPTEEYKYYSNGSYMAVTITYLFRIWKPKE